MSDDVFWRSPALDNKSSPIEYIHCAAHGSEDGPQFLDLPPEPADLKKLQHEIRDRYSHNPADGFFALSLMAEVVAGLCSESKSQVDISTLPALENHRSILQCILRGMIPDSDCIFQDASDDYNKGPRSNINWINYGNNIVEFFYRQERKEDFLQTLGNTISQSVIEYRTLKISSEKGEPVILQACLETLKTFDSDTQIKFVHTMANLIHTAITTGEVPSIKMDNFWKDYWSLWSTKNRGMNILKDYSR
jgi:hypothetical protein